jgi:soluble lytic murein transglycosylase-like protein
VTRSALIFLGPVAALLLATSSFAADSFRFEASDGTVFYTNAPTDPAYRRMGFRTGTAAGWLRLPPADSRHDYTQHVKEAAERYGVPEKLVSAVIRVESGFNARAVSPKGAQGLMQLMPTTASLLGVRDSFNPAENIDGGVRHLKGLIVRFGNNVPLALAAYNAGEQAVTVYGGVPPYPETQGYVAKVLEYFRLADPTAAVTPAALTRTFRLTAADGTTVYTNIPPRPGR